MPRTDSRSALRIGASAPLLLTMAFAATAFGQQPTAATTPPVPDAFRVPLHRHEAEPAVLWASQDDYKVRIAADGMTFYPVLGSEAPRSLPFGWTTTRIGGVPTGAEVPVDHIDWRAELHHDGVVEAYDVLSTGVEQTFVLSAAPVLPATGDYRIEGRVTSELRTERRAPAHGPLTFRDQNGDAVVEYGAALAIDANGARLPLATSCDGAHITIHVPSDWLRSAAYPVVVDPLTSRVAASGTSTSAVWYAQSAVDEQNSRRLLGYARAIAADDYDTYVRVHDTNFGILGTVYTDTTTTSTKDLSLAWVRGSSTWVIAIGVQTASASYVRLRLHPTSSFTTAGGVTRTISQPPGYEQQRPVVGGTTGASNDMALVVFERDPGTGQPDTNSTQVYCALVDTATSTVQPSQPLLAANNNLDAQRPDVMQSNSYSYDWLVAWQQKNAQLPTDDWDIAVARVDPTQGPVATADLPIANSNGLHSFQPKVAGSESDFCVAYLTRPADGTPVTMVGTRLRVQSFYWSPNAPTPAGQSATDYEIAAEATARIELHDSSRAIAFDSETDSHFTVAWRRIGSWAMLEPIQLMVARYGADGGDLERHEVESDVAFAAPYSPVSVSFDATTGTFPLTYGSLPGNTRIWARELQRPNAVSVPYGTSCAGTLDSNHAPFAGSSNFQFKLDGATPDTATWLWAATGSGFLPLPSLTTCPVLLDVSTTPVIVDQGFTNSGGDAYFAFDLPSFAAGLDLYWQAMQLPLGSGTFDLSNGLETRIR